MKREIVLHVGFDKVGSSSLQTYLSNYSLSSKGSNLKYGVINKDGSITTENLTQLASNNPLGYVSSYPNFADESNLDQLKVELDNLFENNVIPIFSSEGWARQPSSFVDNDVLNKIDVEATVIFYVKPQVEWFNSAWWQWFNWLPSYKTPQDYFNTRVGKKSSDWNYFISEWEKIPNVSKVQVRLQSKDNIEDFLSIFNIQESSSNLIKSRSNVSLPPELLKLLCQFPQYRGLHESHVDNKLLKVFNFSGKTPWVIDTALSSQIIENFKDSNELLMNRLDKQQQAVMMNNSKWWDSTAYKDKQLTSLNDFNLTDNEKDELLKQFLDYLLKN